MKHLKFIVFLGFSSFLFLGGCSKNNSSDERVSYLLTPENLMETLPQYFNSLQAAIQNKKTLPKIEGNYFASNAYTVKDEASKRTAEEQGVSSYISVFDSSMPTSNSVQGARGLITFETDKAQKCCFRCVQFGGPGICSNCRASECQFGPGWMCGEQPGSCNPNLCVMIPKALQVPCLY